MAAAAAAVRGMQFPDQDALWQSVCRLKLNETAPYPEFYQRVIQVFKNTVWTEPKAVVDQIDKMVVSFLAGKKVEDETMRFSVGSTSYFFLLQSIGLMNESSQERNCLSCMQEYTNLVKGNPRNQVLFTPEMINLILLLHSSRE